MLRKEVWKRFYEWNGRRSSTSSTIRQSDFIRTRENGHEVADSGPGLRFTRCTMFLIVVIFQGVKSSFLVLLFNMAMLPVIYIILNLCTLITFTLFFVALVIKIFEGK